MHKRKQNTTSALPVFRDGRCIWDVDKEGEFGIKMPETDSQSLPDMSSYKEDRWTLSASKYLVFTVFEKMLMWGSLEDFDTISQDGKNHITVSPWREICKIFQELYPEYTMDRIKDRYFHLARAAFLNQHQRQHFREFFKDKLEVFCILRETHTMKVIYPDRCSPDHWSFYEDCVLVGMVFEIYGARGNIPSSVQDWIAVKRRFDEFNIEGLPKYERVIEEMIVRWKFLIKVHRLTSNGLCPFVASYLQAKNVHGPLEAKTQKKKRSQRRNPVRKCTIRDRMK